MLKKDTLIKLAIILFIFFTGVFIRIDSVNLYGVPDNQRAFFQNDEGNPYMYEIDSYYNYRLTENYLNHGYLGDVIINGKNWDLHSYYPPGRSAEYPPLIVYITAFLYKLVNLFTQIPLLTFCFWLPAFIGPLCGIPAYLFVGKYSNEYGGFTAAILAITAPFYFMRTVPGWFDTDMLNILFPILIAWFFAEAVNNNSKRKQMIYAFLSGFSMFLFSLAWEGWTYLLYIIIAVSILYTAINIMKSNDLKKFFSILIVFFASIMTLIYIFKGISGFETLLFPFQFIEANTQNLWPHTYYSITELQKPSLEDLIVALGPFLLVILFAFFLNSIISITRKQKKYFFNIPDNINLFFYLFLILWIIIGFFALIRGIRFIILLIPPFAILSGFLIGISIDNLKHLKIRKNSIKYLSVLIIFLILSTSLYVDHDNSYNLLPRVNDDFWAGAKWINENTSENTVVISHWVHGYFFAAIANRSVIYDGGSQNTPREYWIDKAFVTGNESLSVGIFRMLSTSGDSGYLTLDNYTKNTSMSVEILNNILGAERNVANQILIKNYGLNEEQTENILKYTHPENPNPFVIVTNDQMIYKGDWIFYFGTWDFSKKEGENSGYTFRDIELNNSTLKARNELFMDLKSFNVNWNGTTPYCVILVNGGHVEKRYLNNKSNTCTVINLDNKKAVILDKKFENSTFVKLIIEKTDSTYFKSIYKNKRVTVWESQEKKS